MNRYDLQKLAKIRMADAQALFAAGRYDGANYMSGYVVECGLKACVARKIVRYEFPLTRDWSVNLYTHDLKKLLIYSQLNERFDRARKADPELDGKWAIVLRWSENSRYALFGRSDAEAILKAVGDRKHGLLKWIRQHW